MTGTVTPFGDRAYLVKVDDVQEAHHLAAVIEATRAGGNAPAGVGESVVGFGNVVVHLDLEHGPPDEVEAWLIALARNEPGPGPEPARARGAESVVIPVAFDGADLAAVAAHLGTTVAEVAAALCDAELHVALVGFAPGFPYLVGLPPDLASVARRPSPRPSVPAGSVAVAGGFASVYPQATPGGWMLLGRTSLPLFDPERPPYALLRPGDTVRFTRQDPPRSAGWRPWPGARPRLAPGGPAFAEVISPGLLSLVQDGGRRSGAAIGVPRAGPADPEAMRLANRLVGNPDDAATIEVTATGPRLHFSASTHLAVVGVGPDPVEVAVDDRPVGAGVVVPIAAGQVVEVGRIRHGLRAYLAVSGGFELPLVVGSRSSDVLCGLGPGALRPGDRLGLGTPTRPHGLLAPPPGPPTTDGHRTLRVVAGPHRLAPGRYRQVLGRRWMVGTTSNRVGLRLVAGPDDPPLEVGLAPAGTEVGMEDGAGVEPGTTASLGAIASTGMTVGAVQMPPDGHPIVLMPDHATVGGYPVACCVISADFPVLGQLAPGDTVSLTEVDLATARGAQQRWEHSLAQRVSGWFPTVAGT